MSHVPTMLYHAYANRAFSTTFTYDIPAEDMSEVAFRVGAVIDITPEVEPILEDPPGDTPEEVGATITVTLGSDDMDVPAGVCPWELVATIDEQLQTLAQGRITISPEPTMEPEEEVEP